MFTDLKFFGLTKARIVVFASISATSALFEGAGMAMFLPVLQFIEKGQDLTYLATSGTWRWLLQVYAWAGITVTLIPLLAVAVGAMCIRAGLVYARQIYTSWLSQTIQHTTRSNLFEAYLAMNLDTFNRMSNGGLINVLTTEAQRAAGSFAALFAFGSNVAVILVFLIVLLWLSVPLTLLALLFLGISGSVVAYYVRHTREHSRVASGANDRYSRLALERLATFRLLKMTATSEQEARRIRHISALVRDAHYRLGRIVARIDLIMEPIVVLCGAAILYLAVSGFGMSLSEVGLFLLILMRLLPLAKEAMKSRQTYLACSGSVAAVKTGYAQSMVSREMSGGTLRFGGLNESIQFRGVSFAYPDAPSFALRDVTLEIPAGRITALVGPSGAGKTTLVDLIPRVREPKEGRVLYDGVDAEDFDLVSLRRCIAFVSQDTALLDDSVLENLRLVRPEATEAEIWRALADAQAVDFVKALPEGLSTVLGDRGIRLSGGQKQRLSLARALLQGTDILILDEPTSALDYETEQSIQIVLQSLRAKGGVTIIIVAHRLTTIRNADRIVVLKDGNLVEQGTHDQLLVGDEWYARVAGLQAGND